MTLAAAKESPRVLEPGARIARKLEVLRHLGEGGMGSLWVARNLTTEAEVAIKVLRPQTDNEATFQTAERFRHEARLGAMLTHRNITRVFDLLEDDDGSLVLVMELLHGKTLLDSWEATGNLSCKDAVNIIVPILGALQHAHEHGIVHRDLKPSNIFLHVDPDGHTTPKLLDFGIAKMHESSVKTLAGDVLGTPSYMSPEQVRASRQLDGRSDIFSIGSMLYEVITGESPFRADLPSATLARVLELEVDPDPRIEPRLWREIQRALAKQPYERHASANELAEALCAAVDLALPRSLRKPGMRSSDPKIEVALEAPAPPPPPASPTTGESTLGPAQGLPKRVPLAKLVVYGVALLLSLGGVLLIIATLRASKNKPDAPEAQGLPSASALATAALSSGRTVASEPSVDTQFEILEPPPTAGRATTPSRVAPRRPPGPSSAKPSASAPSVARTPGF